MGRNSNYQANLFNEFEIKAKTEYNKYGNLSALSGFLGGSLLFILTICFFVKKFFKFINERSKEYIENTSKKRMIIDYMAGQTDSYFLRECEDNFEEFNKKKLYE